MIDFEGSDVTGSGSTNSAQESGASAGEGPQQHARITRQFVERLRLSAAGVYTENKIATNVTASIVDASSVSSGTGTTVSATDQARRSPRSTAPPFPPTCPGESGTKAVAIGIGIARNTIQDSVAAYIAGTSPQNQTQAGTNAPLQVLASEQDSIQPAGRGSRRIRHHRVELARRCRRCSPADNLIGSFDHGLYR